MTRPCLAVSSAVELLHPSAAAGVVVLTAVERPIKTFVVVPTATVAVPTRWSVGLPLSPPSPLSASTDDEWVTRAHTHAAAVSLTCTDEHCDVARSRVPGDRRVCVVRLPNLFRCFGGGGGGGGGGAGAIYNDQNSSLALSQQWHRAPVAHPRGHAATAAAAAAAATAAAATDAGPAPCKRAHRAVRRSSR